MKQKIAHSIAVIQKAAQLAETATGNPLWLAFSGGKDSQVLYHLAEMAGVHFEAHMNATSVDPAEVIRFVRHQYPKVTIHPPKVSIYDMAVRKSTVPTMIARWCCAEYKETAGAGYVTLIGIRKQESNRRAKRELVEKVHRNPNKRRQWNFDQWSDHPESIVQCMGGGKEKIVVSPILDWTETEVWAFLNDILQVPHCKLYDEGQKRIGCILCPMSSYKQKLHDCERYPYAKAKWIEAIAKIKEKQRAINAAHPEKHRASSTETINGMPTPATETPEEFFEWWISGKSRQQFYADRLKAQEQTEPPTTS